jgi:hypothetical protein
MKSFQGCKWSAIRTALFVCLAVSSSVAYGAQDVPQKPAAAGKKIPLPQEDRQAIESYLGKNFIGQPVEAPTIEDPGHIYGLRSGNWKGKITSGKEIGKEHSWTIGPSKDPEGATGWRGAAGDRLVMFIEQDSEGHVVVVGDIEHQHGVTTRYMPPEPLIKKGIKPGESHESDIDVKVYSAKHPDHLKYSGKLNLRYTYVGAYQITVPAGQFEALLFKWHYKGKVGPAKIDDAVYRFFAPGVGPVAKIEFKHISAALVYHDTSKFGIVLTQHD